MIGHLKMKVGSFGGVCSIKWNIYPTITIVSGDVALCMRVGLRQCNVSIMQTCF